MKRLAVAAFAAFALALAQPQTTVRIAVAAPFSGAQKGTGITIQAGGKLAIAEAQKRFTSEGLTLELVSADDQANPQIGTVVARRLVQDTSVLGVIGHMNSGVSLEAMTIYNPAGMPLISASNTNPALTEKGFKSYNRVCGRDDIQGPVAAEFIHNSLRLRRVLVVNDGEAYGIGIANAFRTRARALGLSVVGFITNPIGTLSSQNLSTLTQQFKLYKPDAVYYGGTEAQGGAVVKALTSAKTKAVFVGPDGLDNSNFISVAKDAAQGAYFTSTAGPISQLRGRDVKGFVTRYKALFSAEPETYSPYAYDATNIMLEEF